MNAITQIQPKRSRFNGLLQIARYNWPQYAVAAIAMAVAVPWLCMNDGIHPWLRMMIWVAVILTAWWCIVSLLVSHWIYDRSELYRWTWIPAFLDGHPTDWLNLHAGLDESSDALRELFPNSVGRVGDFFDATEMSEPSIRRARKEQGQATAEQINFRQLPFANGAFDTLFLLFAAHEIRRAASRENFFRELHRVLTPSGRILLVEHARDAANFAAFGPGFFHFMPVSEWHRLAATAGFEITREQRMTPFVRIFLLKKQL